MRRRRRGRRRFWIGWRAVCGLVLATVVLGARPAGAAAARPKTDGLRWPLDLSPAVVSSFGEYRYDHMHAGVDLSTGGAVGLPVHAAADGRVFRIKVEWRGYGRALYLRHADGRISVYGHLQRYEDAVLGLERKVRERQREAKTRYPGDIYLDPPLPVRRGQVIAYSGESGVGLPHLHFEMRGPGDDPIDPFRNGLSAPKQGAPVLESIEATAAAPDSWIDGVLREKILTLSLRQRVYVPDEPLRVSGPFQLDLSGWAPGGGGKAGIRFLEARVDGQTCYRLDFDRFRFDQYPLAGLIYDHRFSRLGPTRMAWRLSALPGNALAQGGCRFVGGDGEPAPGAYRLEDGAHRLEIVARDAAGSESVARICIFSGRPGPITGASAAGAGDGPNAVLRFEAASHGSDSSSAATSGAASTSGAAECPSPGRRVEAGAWDGRRFAPLDCRERDGICSAPAGRGSAVRIRQDLGGVPGAWVWGAGGAGRSAATSVRAIALPAFLDLVAELGAPGAAPEEAGACDGPAWRLLEGLRLGAGVSYASLAALAPAAPPVGSAGCVARQAAEPFSVRWFSPAESAHVEGAGYRVDVPAGGRFFTGPLVVQTLPRGELPEGLRLERDPISIAPDGECLNARATLSFTTDPGESRVQTLGIYRQDDPSGRWSFEGGEFDAASGGVAIGFRRYGRFALLRDEAAPVIRSVRPGAGGSATGRRPEIVASVEDLGKGLDHDGVTFLLDGAPLESEFDPDRGTARPFETPTLTPGRHHLRVQATDRAGNVSAPVEIDFTAR